MSDWNAAQYSKFVKERTLPAIDLANSITCPNPHSILDIGCGIGNSTTVLKNKYPEARIIGADSSEDMLLSAREKYPSIEFIHLDVPKDLDALTERFDIVFSNACIQWIPDHRNLLKKIMDLLNPGGTLAIQIPNQAKHPMHRLMSQIVCNDKWKNKIPVHRKYNNLSEEEYFDILSECSSDFRLWEVVYFHAMPSHKSILEWYKGTGLRPYSDQLCPSDRAEFEHDILTEIEKLYPTQSNNEIIFRFPRLFFTAIN